MDNTERIIPALDAAASTPLDRIPAQDIAAVVRRVQKRGQVETTVDIALFGSAI